MAEIQFAGFIQFLWGKLPEKPSFIDRGRKQVWNEIFVGFLLENFLISPLTELSLILF